MAEFKDKGGRAWAIELDFGLCKVVKERHAIDLLDLREIGKAFVQFAYTDMVLFYELLWTLCEEQAEREEITPEAFGRLINYSALEGAREALEKAIVDFSPSPELREAKERTFRASHDLLKRGLDRITPEKLNEIMDRKLAEIKFDGEDFNTQRAAAGTTSTIHSAN